jgi:hypothetical protein
MIMMYAAAWKNAFKFTKHGWTTNGKFLFEIIILYICTLKFKNDLKMCNFLN